VSPGIEEVHGDREAARGIVEGDRGELEEALPPVEGAPRDVEAVRCQVEA